MIEIWTDGSCLGNPGPGGWAYLIQGNGHNREGWGADPQTTNNRMELLGAIQALQSLQPGQIVTLYSDSQLLVKTMTQGWKRKVNLDLWTQLDGLTKLHQVSWRWVRGHNGHPQNEQVNKLAQEAAALGQWSTQGTATLEARRSPVSLDQG